MTVRAALLLALAAIVATGACRRDRDDDEERRSGSERRLDEQLAPAVATPAREGLAAAIVIDVSGSMDDRVTEASGGDERKIDVARRAARDLVDQFARYAEEHPDEPVLLGIYEFSRRSNQPDCRPVMPMGPPDRGRADAALATLRARGGTPIGSAMIFAKRELDATALTRRHLLVVTDGENTDGVSPQRVAAAIARRPNEERPSLYFVAFDIDARRFDRVRDAGALVLGAANARELNHTLDTLLRGSILVER
ncbi:MAG TPA: VWA domain-containing protein [Vicinamibacterales bacterium]|nr:VWA domain-containing protein [Vicinamibacterales bacterium]